ncbi:MAG: hypothetical protein ACLFUR_05990 [Candidatus Hadarchaeia archaeon]
MDPPTLSKIVPETRGPNMATPKERKDVPSTMGATVFRENSS